MPAKSSQVSERGRLDRFFRLSERGTTVGVELRAGLVTFLTMAYILFVNPQILAQAGMPAADVAVATALSAAIGCLMMGLFANYPFALAPGMGLNAYFTYGVVQGLGVDWQVALTAVFVEGLIFLALALTGLRTAMLEAIPRSIKLATMSGIGLFLAFIGLQNAGLVVDHPATLVQLGEVADVTRPTPLLALGGLLVMAGLMSRRVSGAILIVIVASSGLCWLTGIAPPPSDWLSAPRLPSETLLALDFSSLLSGGLLGAIVAFFFVDLLDTAGTLIGVGQLGGFLTEDGRLPRADRAFSADAVATSVGALLGTSTVTSYVESATGIEEGGRTGLVAVVVALLFCSALLFTPVFVAVPAVATAPALVVVGALMMRGAADIEWRRIEEGLPAFLTIAVMPFTYSIANGLAVGIVAWVLLRLLGGRARELRWTTAILALLLTLFVFVYGP